MRSANVMFCHRGKGWRFWIDRSSPISRGQSLGISLNGLFELETLSRPSLKPLETFHEDDWEDFEFRSDVAEMLTFSGLGRKAQRHLDCARKGFRLRCEGEEHHEFFSPLYCDLRFCPRCAPRRFARLYAKHLPALEYIRRHPIPGFRLREITLTTTNTGTLSSKQIKEFNKHVKKTLRLLMKGTKRWGAICVDEVGFNNTNLHAHILIYCPYIEQARMAAVWREVSGHQVAWIEQAHVFGPKALLHLLKYVSKPPADDPAIIGQLEVAFHGTRRVHALGFFYDFADGDEDNEASEWTTCPKCGAQLVALLGFRPVYQLRSEGLSFIGEFHPVRRRKEWVN